MEELRYGYAPDGLAPSDLWAEPVAEDEAELSARELASVLRRAGNALARARGGPAAAPAPSASGAHSVAPAASAEAVEAERLRVRAAKDEFPQAGWHSSTPAFRMPVAARASPSGTWEHQEAARHRPRSALPTPDAQRAAHVAPAVGRPLRPVERPNSAAPSRRARPPTAPDGSELSGPDAWWDRLAAAKTHQLLLSESDEARAKTAGHVPWVPPQPLASRHDIPTHGNWIRLSEQHPAPRARPDGRADPPPPPGVGGYRQAQPPQRARTPRTFGTAARASPSGTWAHQAAVGNNANRRSRGEAANGIPLHAYGSFLPLQPLLEHRATAAGHIR
ncbi:hypothetical protein KFE25_007862 [Diacronema lutheri]|uniref:Uncharacterized protein n=1 Tax=Diacronema lutheri TaxID=2081491 RepID=A0A8J6CE64_DIALT|nr:hypothetical protein KFE25_007862 [Diacronema lutheri]